MEEKVKTPFHHGHSISRESQIVFLLDNISLRLQVINNMDANYLKENLSKEIEKRYDLNEPTSKDLTEVDSVYNYHIEYILRYMDQLKELVEVAKE